MIAQIAALQDAVSAVPEAPDAWFELGDILLDDGGVNDVPNAVTRAEASLRRARELDPEWVLPLDHQLMAKLWLEDTAGFRALALRWLALDTVPGDRSPYFRWRLGVALGDSAEVARQRASLDRWSDDALAFLAGNAQADAVGLSDVERAIRELERRAVTGKKLWNARLRRLDLLLNVGRPAAALALTDSLASGEPYPGWARVRRIEDALFCVLLGQMLAASVIDHFGLFGALIPYGADEPHTTGPLQREDREKVSFVQVDVDLAVH